MAGGCGVHFNDAGNTNSDSNADFQGDVIWLDPRAPHQLGVQPGSIAHLFKVSSSYTWGQGFQIGGNWRWNSGTAASRTFRDFARSRLELFADIFNLFDNQAATRNQDLLAGAGGIDFGDGIRFTSPRRVFLGLRLNF